MQFEIKNNQYRIRQMDTFTQLKVARKLIPVIASLAPSLGKLTSPDENEGLDTVALLEGMLPEIVSSIAGISDEDFDYLMLTCLKVVSRETGKNNWAPLIQGNEKMFDDIKAVDVIQIIAKVIGDNLGDFLPETLTNATQSQAAG